MSILPNKSILIVDDEEDLREVLQEAFEIAGAKIRSAENGEVAFKLFEEARPDLVITDAKMPKMSGFELVERIKKIEPRFPCIIVSGYAEGLEMRAHTLGVDALIMKPYQIGNLLQFAERILEEKSSRKQRFFVRVNCKVDINTSYGETRSFRSSTVNISEGGMFILCPHLPQPTLGSTIQFEILAQDEVKTSVKGTAICRWLRETGSAQGPRGFGIEFANPSLEILNLMKVLIDKKQVQDPEWL